jgi:hypothetical protein
MTYVVLAAGDLQPSSRYIHIHLSSSTTYLNINDKKIVSERKTHK